MSDMLYYDHDIVLVTTRGTICWRCIFLFFSAAFQRTRSWFIYFGAGAMIVACWFRQYRLFLVVDPSRLAGFSFLSIAFVVVCCMLRFSFIAFPCLPFFMSCSLPLFADILFMDRSHASLPSGSYSLRDGSPYSVMVYISRYDHY